jgi:hypothetical protein
MRVVAITSACAVSLAASPALGAAGTSGADAAGGLAVLRISTVPVVPGARVVLDGVAHLTDIAGMTTISTFAGRHRIDVLPPKSPARGSAVRFSRWLDGIALARRSINLHQGLNSQQAGFQVSHPIRVRFSDGAGRAVPLSAVQRVTMANSLGQRFSFAPGKPPKVLAANRIVRDQFGLHALPIRYSVRNVIFDGANVVYGGSQSFFVHVHSTWTIRLLLFPMHITVRDALFGFAIGSEVRVRLIGGSDKTVKLGPGHAVTLKGMPRATYQLVAKGPGFGLSSPATLTKPLDARLLLLSWIDFVAVAGFVLLFVLGLPLLGGRIRRRKDGARLPAWHVGHPPDHLGRPDEPVGDQGPEVTVPAPSELIPAVHEPLPEAIDDAATSPIERIQVGECHGHDGLQHQPDAPAALAGGSGDAAHGQTNGIALTSASTDTAPSGNGVHPGIGTAECDDAGPCDRPAAAESTFTVEQVREAARLAWERRSELHRRAT